MDFVVVGTGINQPPKQVGPGRAGSANTETTVPSHLQREQTIAPALQEQANAVEGFEPRAADCEHVPVEDGDVLSDVIVTLTADYSRGAVSTFSFFGLPYAAQCRVVHFFAVPQLCKACMSSLRLRAVIWNEQLEALEWRRNAALGELNELCDEGNPAMDQELLRATQEKARACLSELGLGDIVQLRGLKGAAIPRAGDIAEVVCRLLCLAGPQDNALHDEAGSCWWGWFQRGLRDPNVMLNSMMQLETFPHIAPSQLELVTAKLEGMKDGEGGAEFTEKISEGAAGMHRWAEVILEYRANLGASGNRFIHCQAIVNKAQSQLAVLELVPLHSLRGISS